MQAPQGCAFIEVPYSTMNQRFLQEKRERVPRKTRFRDFFEEAGGRTRTSRTYAQVSSVPACVTAVLQQRDAGCTALLQHGIRPNTYLRFSNMCLTQKIHAQAALADTAAHSLRQRTGKQFFME